MVLFIEQKIKFIPNKIRSGSTATEVASLCLLAALSPSRLSSFHALGAAASLFAPGVPAMGTPFFFLWGDDEWG